MIKTPLSTMVGGAGIWTPGCTVIGSQKTLTQLIKSMFANGEQGFTRDPYDLTTLYQDAAGTIPVTGVGQPVGLVLDKSKGLVLGSELFNQTIDFPTWTKTAVVTSAVGNTFTTNGLGGCIKNPVTFGMSSQKSYNVRIVGICTVTHKIRRSSSVVGEVLVPAGAFDITIKSPITFFDSTLYFQLQSSGTMTVTSISIKEIAGNHAYQATSSMRPLLQDSPHRIDYDAVDDKLITTLPAQLSGCTVILAVPNVGTQILLNQTIATPYNDSTDHCGLIVINRALTAIETAQITRLFNKAAGV